MPGLLLRHGYDPFGGAWQNFIILAKNGRRGKRAGECGGKVLPQNLRIVRRLRDQGIRVARLLFRVQEKTLLPEMRVLREGLFGGPNVLTYHLPIRFNRLAIGLCSNTARTIRIELSAEVEEARSARNP